MESLQDAISHYNVDLKCEGRHNVVRRPELNSCQSVIISYILKNKVKEAMLLGSK